MFQVGKSTTDPTKLGPLGKDISKIYNDIAKDTKGAVKTVGNPEVRHEIVAAFVQKFSRS